uniref:Reverse transcriptase Ty1/copia-type domain-containing protein n=1 Tax=Glossina austeni TaxID=7395 RepID=A0A1A9UNJ1_GLOAU
MTKDQGCEYILKEQSQYHVEQHIESATACCPLLMYGFFDWDFHEDIYVKVLAGMDTKFGMCKLMKSLYGLTKASRYWNIKFIGFPGLVPALFDPRKFTACIPYLRNTMIT